MTRVEVQSEVAEPPIGYLASSLGACLWLQTVGRKGTGHFLVAHIVGTHADRRINLFASQSSQSNREDLSDDYVCLSDRRVTIVYGLEPCAASQNFEHRAVGRSAVEHCATVSARMDSILTRRRLYDARSQMRARDLIHVGTLIALLAPQASQGD